jgi:hypothetical protein
MKLPLVIQGSNFMVFRLSTFDKKILNREGAAENKKN